MHPGRLDDHRHPPSLTEVTPSAIKGRGGWVVEELQRSNFGAEMDNEMKEQLELPTHRDDKHYQTWLDAINNTIDMLIEKYSLSEPHAIEATMKAMYHLREYRAMFFFKESKMKDGLLWYDNDPKKPLEMKIDRAMARHMERLGTVPNLVYVNPGDYSDEEIAQIEIKPKANILKHHILVGVK